MFVILSWPRYVNDWINPCLINWETDRWLINKLDCRPRHIWSQSHTTLTPNRQLWSPLHLSLFALIMFYLMVGRHPMTSRGKGCHFYEAIFHKGSCYDLIRLTMWSHLMCITNFGWLGRASLELNISSGRTCYREMSRSVEAARLCVKIIVSLCMFPE